MARFLRSEEMQRQAAGQVVVVDEAGLLGSRDMAALFEVAERVNARVILLGDRYQNTSPARGAPLKLLEEQAGVPSVTVDEIVRAAGRLQAGDAAAFARENRRGIRRAGQAGLDSWKCRTRIAIAGWPRLIVQFSAEKKKGGKDKTVLVVTPTHREAAQITAAIRAELAAQGRLGEERRITRHGRRFI